ncbi:hypothetical protein BGE01nite_34710 [Brevifollis gellanilyticus]|uniref:Uncharacterized protein n=1 Tax=Brevifollis gellanilyticus TaxID=748831 RepID=A0A512MBQ7_9BACT|nr:hypothetical protein BGE01nite_34710 [Brevifollis gellanilyticus]
MQISSNLPAFPFGEARELLFELKHFRSAHGSIFEDTAPFASSQESSFPLELPAHLPKEPH